MSLFRWFFNLFKGHKSGYSIKDFWGRTVHYNKYGEKIGYTVKTFWGRRNRYDANWNLISYSVKNFWGGYNTYDADGNLISKSYKNIFGGYTTYDKNGVKKRVSYKGFWNVMKHFDLEETCVYERGNVRKTTYSPRNNATVDYVKNDMVPKANIVKVSQEVKAASAVQTKQENSQKYHSEGNKEYLKSSGIVAQEKIPVILEEHNGVAIEGYSKSVSNGQHIHKTAEYYQSVEDYVKTEKMRKFLRFVHDDVVYCKYYEVVYILFHTGMRISEFCGLTLKDIDLENRIVNIDHQLQRTCDMRYIIEPTKTDAGTRKLPITEDVARMFQAIIEDREPPKMEKVIDGYTGFLFYDVDDNPLVAMHWQHRFNHMVGRYNDIYWVQMPNITPHVCRHTYCSNMEKSGMNPKTLQYLMGHSDISITMNVYTHISFDDAEEELKRMEEFRKAQAEIEKKNDAKAVSQKMFKVI